MWAPPIPLMVFNGHGFERLENRVPIWDGIQIAPACIMMISGTSMRPIEGLSPRAATASRGGAEESHEAISPTYETESARSEHHETGQLPARTRREHSVLHGDSMPQTVRMPQSAFAAQMLDQWSGEDDRGVYLLRERAYRQRP